MKPSATLSADPTDALARRLYDEHRQDVFRRADRLFAGLMLFQWAAGIAAALFVSPRAWAGQESSVHPHVWAAAVLGGLVAGLPVALAVIRPGRTSTRHAVAIGQMLMGALLIHLTGGRIETHFHVFGSLALLSFYRDWRVLVPATVVVACDHFVRGAYFPQSVYGVLWASPWRTLEHAGWVIFENVFLIASCVRSTREMWAIAHRTAALRNSEARYERMSANAPGMVYQYLLRPDGTASFPFASEGCRGIYGVEPQDVLTDGSLLTRMVVPADRAALEASIAETGWRKFSSAGSYPPTEELGRCCIHAYLDC